MKKLIASVIAAASIAGSASAFIEMGDVSAKLEGQFVSESVVFGKRVAGQAVNSHLQVSVPVDITEGAEIYVGHFSNHPFNSNKAAEGVVLEQGDRHEIYAGFSTPVFEMFSIDLGYTYRAYTETAQGAVYAYDPMDSVSTNSLNRSHEVYFGVLADVLLSPAAYVFYDFNLEQFRFEGSIAYSIDLEEQLGLESTALDLGAYVGYLHAGAYNGDQRATGVKKHKNGYTYYGLTADVVYTINEVAKVSVGGELAGNNDGNGLDDTGRLSNIGGDNKIFWNAKVSFGF